LRDEAIDRGLMLLELAQRAVQQDLEPALARVGIGRQEHAVLDLVARRRGLTVAELTGLVALSKQSVSRIVGGLVGRGLLTAAPGRGDARRRPLAATPQGHALLQDLAGGRRRRLRRAFREAGPDAVIGFERVLADLLDPAVRQLAEAATAG
jgi:DNA-binding MarR family transcriptional regulator